LGRPQLRFANNRARTFSHDPGQGRPRGLSMVWFVLAGMAAVAVLSALWPVLRPLSSASPDAASSEARFYKAQLEEIRRDVERGCLLQSEAESARAEAARRFIAASSGVRQAPLAAPRAASPIPALSASCQLRFASVLRRRASRAGGRLERHHEDPMRAKGGRGRYPWSVE
jgi:cytochrome c-type biogenesis protein CcmI